MDQLTALAADGVPLHVSCTGEGAEVVVLSGGPGCVHYLADERIAPAGLRSWFPEPRGAGRSGGGPHDMARAVADLEDIRGSLGVARRVVLGHSWGSDLAARCALDHPERVTAVVGIAGHGMHKDRNWSEIYQAQKHTEEAIHIDWSHEAHAALNESFLEWIHEPGLYRSRTAAAKSAGTPRDV